MAIDLDIDRMVQQGLPMLFLVDVGYLPGACQITLMPCRPYQGEKPE
ncbi:hypothetical protein [Sphaerisporangium sp. NPDC051011]